MAQLKSINIQQENKQRSAMPHKPVGQRILVLYYNTNNSVDPKYITSQNIHTISAPTSIYDSTYGGYTLDGAISLQDTTITDVQKVVFEVFRQERIDSFHIAEFKDLHSLSYAVEQCSPDIVVIRGVYLPHFPNYYWTSANSTSNTPHAGLAEIAYKNNCMFLMELTDVYQFSRLAGINRLLDMDQLIVSHGKTLYSSV